MRHGTGVFQSTPSGGKATQTTRPPHRAWTFQSTPSGGKATVTAAPIRSHERVSIHAFRGEGDRQGGEGVQRPDVSIHAFRGEGDAFGEIAPSPRRSFNPRLPGGRRRSASGRMIPMRVFQSTPSGGKATSNAVACPRAAVGFNPRLPGGRRRIAAASRASAGMVSIHAFRGEGDGSAVQHRSCR